MTLDTETQLIVGLLVVSVAMLILWLIQFATCDAGIVDVGWAGSLGLLAVFYGLTTSVQSWRTLLVATIATIWSCRLANYLLFDRIIGKPEDGRYQALRTRFGSKAPWFFLIFFLLQGVLAWGFAFPFLIAMTREGDSFDAFDLMGLCVWFVAVLGEMTADRQLAQFRRDPENRGRTCRRGLWNYSRHPNYFFEWLHWWGYVMISVGSPWFLFTFIAPLVMLFFLFKVTGIPATEAHALRSRGDDYRDYQRTTSVFIPWFPRK